MILHNLIVLFNWIITDTRDIYDHNIVTYKMAEMEMRVDHLTRLYELKEKNVQELIKHFSSVLKSIMKSLNVSVSDDIESLMAIYNKTAEMVRSPMARFDVYTFLPHLRSHKDYLRPLILHSGGRNAGYLIYFTLHGDKFIIYLHKNINKYRIIHRHIKLL